MKVGLWTSVVLGGIMWGLGVNLLVGIALGYGGTIAFVLGLLFALAYLYRQGFRKKRTAGEVWVTVFWGLIIQALLYPMANLIMGLTSPDLLSKGIRLSTMLVYSGFMGIFLALAFYFVIRILHTQMKVESRRTFRGK